jgi:putative tryptophan/tyrosine transport system substrate-binding protein
MNRRHFITLLGGAAAWPLAARAQQGDRVRRIGVLRSAGESDPETQHQLAAFRDALQKLGWNDGRNVRIEYRYADGDLARIRRNAAEMAAMRPDAILVSGDTATSVIQQETSTIPIVFVQVNDPLGHGIVPSLARPGGNVTGFTPSEFSIGGKMLEVLKDLAPEITRAAAILVPDLGDQIGMWRTIEAAAPSLGVQATLAGVQDVSDLEPAIRSFASNSNGGLIVVGNRVTIAHRELTISLVARYRLPAIYSYKFFVADGGLASYGSELTEQYRRAAGYVDRILRGESPSVLPVQQPTKFELAINLKTAKALGLTVPPTLFARADEIIE